MPRLTFKSPAEYRAYVLSDRWKRRRDAFYRSQGGAAGYVCCVKGCGVRRMLECHHLTYARVGFERDEDLCWVCPRHHEMAGKGLIKFTVYRRKTKRKKKLWKL